PHIAWNELAVKVASEAVSWTRNGVARIAGVSSFGVSGTNAHVILEEAPVEAAIASAPPEDAAEAAEAPSPPPLSAWPVLLSAKSEAALRGQAERLRAHLCCHEDLALSDVAWSLATTRAQFEHRAAVVAGDRTGLLAALEAVAKGCPHPTAVLGRA